ncbi:Lipase 3 [Diaporthe amygdali]|uniref:Lipase 3 n=1 Tax=Phomopsis amygdali TaxID=1214568 RepID=UPI0022FE2031|nr:Lipase 3 [Diaporthe amygdali]KAJ0115178.1 Lipase 3 [Diaporthe amygdali]
MSEVNPETPNVLLPHLSINPESRTTLLLLHGAFSSKETWKPVHRHLEQYHLLIPTLPEHHEASNAPGVGELSLPNTSKLLSDLVDAKANNGRVHLIGHSFGANVALHFASHNPTQILSVFVAGTAGFVRSKMTPYALWLDGILSYAMPKSLIEYLIDADPSLRGTESFGGLRPIKLCNSISEILMIGVDDKELVPATAKQEFRERDIRVLAAAATKKGALPTNDNVERAKAVAERLGGVAAEVPTMRHAWFFQDPGLFARTVIAWVQKAGLPVEVHIL